jgi:hypothetical protein
MLFINPLCEEEDEEEEEEEDVDDDEDVTCLLGSTKLYFLAINLK